MSKQDDLWEIVRELAIRHPNWEVSLPVLFDIANKRKIYSTRHHYKQAVKNMQNAGKVEITGNTLRIRPGRLLDE